jgi:acetoin utilization deacetylase AcuC-like enzyme
MSLAMPVVWSESCRLHDPGGEIWVGVRTEGTEVAARVDAVRDSLLRNGARIVEAESHPDESLLRVHDDSLLSYLASAWEEWSAAGLPEDPGQDRVVPYVFAHVSLTSGRPPHIPAATWAKPGYFAYDTMTLVGPGTWEAARAAVDVALTAVDLVLDGEPTAYGCCRPPGHHAAHACYGGSCYLNNAAVVDPGAGWFPHFLGFADETGAGAGEGGNVNIPRRGAGCDADSERLSISSALPRRDRGMSCARPGVASSAKRDVFGSPCGLHPGLTRPAAWISLLDGPKAAARAAAQAAPSAS